MRVAVLRGRAALVAQVALLRVSAHGDGGVVALVEARVEHRHVNFKVTSARSGAQAAVGALADPRLAVSVPVVSCISQLEAIGASRRPAASLASLQQFQGGSSGSCQDESGDNAHLATGS